MAKKRVHELARSTTCPPRTCSRSAGRRHRGEGRGLRGRRERRPSAPSPASPRGTRGTNGKAEDAPPKRTGPRVPAAHRAPAIGPRAGDRGGRPSRGRRPSAARAADGRGSQGRRARARRAPAAPAPSGQRQGGGQPARRRRRRQRPVGPTARLARRARSRRRGRRLAAAASSSTRRPPARSRWPGGPGGGPGGPPRRPRAARGRRRRGTLRRHRPRRSTTGGAQRAPTSSSINSGSTVKDVAEYLGVPVPEIIKKLMGMGEMATLTQTLSDEAIRVLAEEFGKEIEIVHAGDEAEAEPESTRTPTRTSSSARRSSRSWATSTTARRRCSTRSARPRSPRARPAASPSTSAPTRSTTDERRLITFLDTPGPRGVHRHARPRRAGHRHRGHRRRRRRRRAARRPTRRSTTPRRPTSRSLVAVNKIDKEGADPTRVRTEMTQRGLQPVEWGGDTEFVDVSAKTQRGPRRPARDDPRRRRARGAQGQPRRRGLRRRHRVQARPGPRPGRHAARPARHAARRRRARRRPALGQGPRDARLHRRAHRARPCPATRSRCSASTACPTPASTCRVVENDRAARQQAERARARGCKTEAHARRSGRKVSLEDVFSGIQRGRAQGAQPRAQGRRRRLGRGARGRDRQAARRTRSRSTSSTPASAASTSPTSCSPRLRARSSSASTCARSATPRAVAEREGVEIRDYSVIYKALDDLRDAMQGMLAPEEVEETDRPRSRSARRSAPRSIGTIAGSYVTEGKVTRGAKMRLVRDGTVVHDGDRSRSLRRFNDDVREVAAGLRVRHRADELPGRQGRRRPGGLRDAQVERELA